MARRRSKPQTSDRTLLKRVRAATGASDAQVGEHVQTLWDGYGEVLRVELEGAATPTVIVKRVRPPARGGNGRSHRRKLRSYEVETAWYRTYASRCDDGCRTPRALLCEAIDGGWLFVLEDLDDAGFAERRGWRFSDDDRMRCLSWLAELHATFLGQAPDGLWKVGTYWHLATRPDELARLTNPPLRAAAGKLDEALNRATFKTLVHGDAKIANFCFGPGGVAAVDFQYVGGGCGMKDVAYFLSCLGGGELQAHADRLLDGYFRDLRAALARRAVAVDPDAVEQEWRALYPLAWADFYRFLGGWAPGHSEAHAYARQQIDAALKGL